MNHAKEMNLDTISKKYCRCQPRPTFRIMSMIVTNDHSTRGGIPNVDHYICRETLMSREQLGVKVGCKIRALSYLTWEAWMTIKSCSGEQKQP